jgi:hypothetical protein
VRACLKSVNQHNAPILPIVLATKLLPEMEEERAELLERHRLAAGPIEVEQDYEQLTVRIAWQSCIWRRPPASDSRKVLGRQLQTPLVRCLAVSTGVQMAIDVAFVCYSPCR